MCCKSEQSNNCFDKIFLVRIWKFTPVLVWLKALVRIHNLIQECLMFWFFWSDETHGDAEILGMQIWNFRYANMDFYKTSHIQIWFLGKDPVFEYEFLVLFSHPCLPLHHHFQKCWRKTSPFAARALLPWDQWCLVHLKFSALLQGNLTGVPFVKIKINKQILNYWC